MKGRASLPGADELFRVTSMDRSRGSRAAKRGTAGAPEAEDRAAERVPSGRQRHDEKVTFYCTAEELMDLENARLQLRRHGIAVDRGRLVREALAQVLSELERDGADASLVKRLSSQ